MHGIECRFECRTEYHASSRFVKSNLDLNVKVNFMLAADLQNFCIDKMVYEIECRFKYRTEFYACSRFTKL